LIDDRTVTDAQSWIDHYYNSGEKRQAMLDILSEPTRACLNDRLLPYNDQKTFDALTEDFKCINYEHGRTKSDLLYKAEVLHHHCKKSISKITYEDAIVCVKYRIMGETWNGIKVREVNTIKGLQKKLPHLTFEKTTGAFDHQYAVDYNLYYKAKLICGIQIKPKSYTYNKPYILKAKAANKNKNVKYTEEYDVEVLDIISSQNGTIYNPNAINKIIDLSRS
jgi:hypothetical protein